MYWSRRWKVHNCKPCNYIGIAKNAKSVCTTSGSCTRNYGRDVVQGRFGGMAGSAHLSNPEYRDSVIIPNDKIYENVHCPKERTNKYLIKSGLQPNNNEPKYSYGYNNYLKNKRKMTYEMKLPTSKSRNSIIIPSQAPASLYDHLPVENAPLYGHGGKCSDGIINGCNVRKTTAKFSNKKYYKQGAVDSSDRIRRLKLNASGVGDETQCNICPTDYINPPTTRAPHYNYKQQELQWKRNAKNAFTKVVGAGGYPFRYKKDHFSQKIDTAACKENKARRRVLGVYKNNGKVYCQN
jgi:hypothetical protein